MAGGAATPRNENGFGYSLPHGDFGSFFGHLFSMSCGYFQKN
jgi:hypothetical protein